MGIELLERDGLLLGEVLRANVEVETTTFFSPSNATFQLGLMSHKSGFVEKPHFHPILERPKSPAQQFFYVIRGVVYVDFFLDSGERDFEIILNPGDSIVIIDGVHSLRVAEDSKCITVKQGPFPGIDMDKIEVEF